MFTGNLGVGRHLTPQLKIYCVLVFDARTVCEKREHMVQCVRDIRSHGANDLTRRFACQHPRRQSLSQSLGCLLGWDIRCGSLNTLYLGAAGVHTRTCLSRLEIHSVYPTATSTCGQPGWPALLCLSTPRPQREHLGFVVGLRDSSALFSSQMGNRVM